MKFYSLVLALLLSGLTHAADDSLRAALKGKVFADAQAALRSANEVNASTLTPETYRRAGERFKRAQELFDRGADVDRVRDVVNEAEEPKRIRPRIPPPSPELLLPLTVLLVNETLPDSVKMPPPSPELLLPLTVLLANETLPE